MAGYNLEAMRCIILKENTIPEEFQRCLDACKTQGIHPEIMESLTEPVKYSTSALLLSFLLPSRQRFSLLDKTLRHLNEKTKNKDQIEVILGFDIDDSESISQLVELSGDISITVLIQARKGYQLMADYLKHLAYLAQGGLLGYYTDDIMFQTYDWDTFIEPFRNKLCILKLKAHQRLNILPIFSRFLFHAMDRLSPHACADTYLEDIGTFLGIEVAVPEVIVYHDESLQLETSQTKEAIIGSYTVPTISKERHLDIIKIVKAIHSRIMTLKNTSFEELKAMGGLEEYRDLIQVYRQIHGLQAYHHDPVRLYSRSPLLLGLNFVTDTLEVHPETQTLMIADRFHDIDDPLKTVVIEIVSLIDLLKLIYLDSSYQEAVLEEVAGVCQVLLRLHEVFKDHVIILYYLAFTTRLLNLKDEAIGFYQAMVRLVDRVEDKTPQALWSMVVPLGTPYFLMLWEQITYGENTPQEQIYQYKQLLKWQAWQALSELHQEQRELNKTQLALLAALGVFPSMTQSQVALLGADFSISSYLRYRIECPFFTDLYAPTLEQLSQLPELQAKDVLDDYMSLSGLEIEQYKKLLTISSIIQKHPADQGRLPEVVDLLFAEPELTLYSRFVRLLKHPLFKDWIGRESFESRANLCWNPLCPEVLPDIVWEMGFEKGYSENDTEIKLGNQVFQRSYSLNSQQVDPIKLPYLFAPSKVISNFELEGSGEMNYLYISDDLANKSSIDFIRTFAQYFANQAQVSCVLWSPEQKLQESDIEYLGEQLDIETEANLILLSEKIPKEQQVELLQKMQVIVAQPHNYLNYYLWWGLYLAIPIFVLGEGLWPLIESDELDGLIQSDIQQGLESYFRHYHKYCELARRFSDELNTYYSSNLESQILKALWHLKIQGYFSKQ